MRKGNTFRICFSEKAVIEHGLCKVDKVKNYASKGERIYATNEYGTGFMFWLEEMKDRIVEIHKGNIQATKFYAN